MYRLCYIFILCGFQTDARIITLNVFTDNMPELQGVCNISFWKAAAMAYALATKFEILFRLWDFGKAK